MALFVQPISSRSTFIFYKGLLRKKEEVEEKRSQRQGSRKRAATETVYRKQYLKYLLLDLFQK
jgi:hypothetical protein